MKRKTRATYPMLRDEGNEVAASYGLRFRLSDELIEIYKGFGIDLEQANGEGSQTLPLPARLIIDPEGIVRDVDADPDYTVRPDPQKTVETLKSLK